jgi:beta-N-acetylhexosaminidase
MSRHFHDLPCVLLSFGSPYHSYDAPQCPIVINAYSPVPTMQRAAVEALTGAIPFSGVSPVNAHAGLDEGELIADTAVRHTPSAATPQPGSGSDGDHSELP